ncbi:hypothetical protein P3T35_003904 [Kitasatospora sp. GP30]|nr:hypothetical protein [Kitasatospora sp. GP30]
MAGDENQAGPGSADADVRHAVELTGTCADCAAAGPG